MQHRTGKVAFVDSVILDKSVHCLNSIWTCKYSEIRIKPKKETRVIGVFKDKTALTGKTIYRNTEISYESIEQLKESVHAPHGFNGYQFIEIEIEV